ncbi:glycosyltransferase family 4 protein [Mycobacterium sp. MYCO198283]|uniref:glycosyltransferase family 4 protein n=1 Tax=Mycobacterium sp. MYCO198283 TaxID=2883505 RepID=UPI001E3FE48D|nr:glycosyltransferase family 4 protein [Mycobacterium sp. MYCO198283]MCG5433889.1 glycosyltransferase family 4 protein [Mycobacterium sp. MYCO198283]
MLWLSPWMRPLARVQAEALQRRGVQVLLVTTDAHPESDTARDYELVLDTRLRTLSTWPASLAARRRILDFAADIAVTELVHDPRWIAFAGRLPRVQIVHDDVLRDPGERLPSLKQSVFTRWAASSTATVVYSRYVAARIADRRDVAGMPVYPVPLCSDLDPALVPPLAPAAQRRDFVMFGRLNPYKNLDVVLDAWSSHVAGPGWRGDELVLLGDGVTRSLPGRVRWLPGNFRYRDVVEVLARAKGSVVHYREASQSGVQVLSMQLGVTPLASTAGALPEFQPPGGRAVGIDDVAGLTALFDDLADPQTAAWRGSAAARHYAGRFTADHTAEALHTVLKTTRAAARGRPVPATAR